MEASGESGSVQRAPTAADNAKFGIWVWLASDCALFASLIATYLSLHTSTAKGPVPGQLFDLSLTALATFVLLSSSVAMGLAVEAAQTGRREALRTWLAVTALLGLCFVGLQAFEFTSYGHEGLHFATSDFASSFFVLVGFHGLHVSFGVAWLIGLLVLSLRRPDGLGRAAAWRVEAASLYWYFVDVVWVVIFTVVYLMGKVR